MINQSIPTMSDPKEEFKNHRPKKKKKMTVPAEFLQEAKSYDDKLVLVKTLTEMEKGRVLLIIKNMLSDAVKARDKK